MRKHPEGEATWPKSHTGIYFLGSTDLPAPGNRGRGNEIIPGESRADLGLLEYLDPKEKMKLQA